MSSAPTRPSTTATARSLPRSREITDGRGVNVIYDPVGGSLSEDAAGAMARHGRLLAVGFASGEWPKLVTHDLVVTNTSLVGVFAGGYSREELDNIHTNLAGLVSDGRLRNAVTAQVRFDELPAALQRMADRRRGRQARDGAVTSIPTLDATGKVVVVTGGSKGLGRAMVLGFAGPAPTPSSPVARSSRARRSPRRCGPWVGGPSR